ncbi:hypothetical protein [Phreatobacter sp.]|uniref:hypothetical protein n=1 Tax=Phreatobacter sp. TaxID=1966341 RepID=UPI003F6FB79C
MTQSYASPIAETLSPETLPEGEALGLVADALVAALLARVRTMRILLEAETSDPDPDSPEGRLHARLTDTEQRLRDRLSAMDARTGGERVFLD